MNFLPKSKIIINSRFSMIAIKMSPPMMVSRKSPLFGIFWDFKPITADLVLIKKNTFCFDLKNLCKTTNDSTVDHSDQFFKRFQVFSVRNCIPRVIIGNIDGLD